MNKSANIKENIEPISSIIKCNTENDDNNDLTETDKSDRDTIDKNYNIINKSESSFRNNLDGFNYDNEFESNSKEDLDKMKK